MILFLLIEGLMRRDISLRIKERVYQAAFVFLVLFAVMVIYNDLMKTMPGLMDRLPVAIYSAFLTLVILKRRSCIHEVKQL